MAITQEEIQARIAAAIAKRGTVEKINNTDLVNRATEDGIRVVHINPDFCVNGTGMTVAYKANVRNPAVVEIATAVCRKGDTFSRKMGTKTAILSFRTGNTALIPVDRRLPPAMGIRRTFY